MSASTTTPDREAVLDVDRLGVDFDLGDRAYPVVSDVSIRLRAGERVALVGESGSGKTVTALSLLGLLPSIATVSAGTLEVAGHRVLELSGRDLDRVRGNDVAMIFQDPMSSLNPVLRVDQQLTGPIRRHLGVGRAEARERALGLIAQVGIPEPERCLRAYPHELSGGMRQRVMIAMALSCEPRLLLADEPTTALDVTIQAQIIRLLTSLSDELGLACLLVTHDLGVVARFAHRLAVMYAGRIVEEGAVADVFTDPKHPYTQALLASVPSTDRRRPLRHIEGAPPSLRSRGSGCGFADRCPLVEERCRRHVPPLVAVGDVGVACHLASPTAAAPRSPEVDHANS